MKAVLLNTKHDQRLCADGRYLCDAGGIARAELLPLHHPFAGIPSPCAKVDPPQPSLIDLVNYLHQRLATGLLLPVSEQISLAHIGRGEIG